MVVFEQSTQAFATTNRLVSTTRWRLARREQQNVALTLMVPFLMEMVQIFAKCMPQRSFTKENEL